MESPERTENIPAPVDQGSPFFKYLCGLSPIKPAKSMHVIQTYAELSLPPPPAVFTSPANPDRCGGRAKRGLLANRTAATQVTVETVSILGNDWVGDKENQPNQLYISRSNAAAQGDGGQSSSQAISEYSQQQHVLCPRLEQGQVGDSTGEHSLRFEYNDVANYLADPSEGGLYAPASSAQLQNSYVRKSSTSEDYSYPREDDDVDKSINDDNLSSDSQDRIHTRDHDTNFSNGGLPELHAISYVRSHQQYLPADRRESLASAASGSSSDHEGSGAEAPSRLDQETAAMASYLLAGDMDFDDGARGDWINSHSSLSKLPHHQTPDFAAYERLSNLAPRSRENFELAGSKAPESQRVVDLDSKNMAMEDRKDVQISGTVGQRGVRRRCLDFETSVRRKSLGGAGSRKSMALRSKTGPGSGGASAASNIPSSILCERAVATSDATNSTVDPAAASDPQSDILLRPRGTSSTKGLSAGLLRVSRCSVQKISESTAGDVCMADPPKISRDCVSVPSGIGLHLNSLTGGISFSPTNREFKQTLGVSPAPKGAVASLLGMTALSGVMHENGPDNFGNNMVGMGNAGSVSKNFSLDSSSGFGSGVMISVMERSRVTLRETIPGTNPGTGVLKATTLQSLTVGGRQSLDGSNNAIVLEKPGSSGKKRIQHQEVPPPPNVDFQDEYDSPRSSKKRRKSPTAAGEKSGDGCKRCNCKKSKCLKLYCECFAAGTYCVGSCTCHDCFNKPEHEETVLSTRQLIESRNPLAFAPKIVHSNDASPKRGQEEILETPASARHKRGCNCKKSLCLKKYCECYQAGVGCSEGCRCEGCKNMYGRKEAVEDSDKEIASDVPESGSPEAELELPSAGSEGPVGHIYPLRSNGKDLSPTTPSFQYTGAVCRQGRTIGRVRSATKKRSTSPLSQSQPVGKPSPSPDCLTRSSLGLQSEKSNAQQTPNLQHARISPISTPKLSRGNQLSPRWDGLGDICTLTPLAHPPLRPTPASLSTIDRTGASPSFSCQSIEPISSYQPDNFDSVSKSSPPRFQQAPNLSPLSSFGSRGLQSLSNHPVPTTSCLPSSFDRQGSSKALVVAQSGHLSSLLSDDDDTPDFLKYSAGVNSSITKRGSPKQKRVSPPHLEGVRNTSRDGRIVFNSPAKSSPGLRSGRKFILQALPALPPLLPLSGSSPGQICSNTQKQV